MSFAKSKALLCCDNGVTKTTTATAQQQQQRQRPNRNSSGPTETASRRDKSKRRELAALQITATASLRPAGGLLRLGELAGNALSWRSGSEALGVSQRAGTAFACRAAGSSIPGGLGLSADLPSSLRPSWGGVVHDPKRRELAALHRLPRLSELLQFPTVCNQWYTLPPNTYSAIAGCFFITDLRLP